MLDRLAAAADEAGANGAHLTEAQLVERLARATRDAEHIDRVERLAADFDGDLWPVRVRHLRALADGAPSEEREAIAAAYRELGAIRQADVAVLDR